MTANDFKTYIVITAYLLGSVEVFWKPFRWI